MRLGAKPIKERGGAPCAARRGMQGRCGAASVEPDVPIGLVREPQQARWGHRAPPADLHRAFARIAAQADGLVAQVVHCLDAADATALGPH